MTGRLIRWAQPVFFVLASISIGVLLYSQWPDLRAYPWTLNLGWFLVASALLLVTWVVEVGIWWHMLRYMGGPLPFLAGVRIWFLSAVMRYIPGNIWQPLSMTLYCKRHGIRAEATLTSIILYQVVILLAVAPIGAAYLLLFGNLGLLSDMLSVFTPGLITLALAPVVVFLVRPEYLMAMLDWGLSKFGRPRLEAHLSSRRLLSLVAVAIFDWLLWGATFTAFTFALSEFDTTSQLALVPHLIAAFPIAYAIGFMSLITPSGFGVREGAFFLLLSPLMDGAAITVIALAMRIWTAGGELLIAAISAPFERHPLYAQDATVSTSVAVLDVPAEPELRQRVDLRSMQQRSHHLSLLAFVTLCAFGIRMVLLDTQSLWYDEGVTAEIAHRGIAELTRWTADDIQPPLYYYVVAIWGRLAGWSEWSLRFPSVFFGTLIPPLLAVTALVLTRKRLAATLVALLAALHPLLVYYSQEARMYALLTALGVLLAYLVIHIASSPENRRWYWVAYVLAATAAVYTHYFAFFLLLALGIAFVADQLLATPTLSSGISGPSAQVGTASRPKQNALLGFLLANALILVLYLPWFAALITRLSVDSSYWEGEFKYDEALRHIAISFIGGETILESQAVTWFIPFALITVILLAVLLVIKPRQVRTALFSFLWLAIPVAAVLTLASLVPKFNARYVMIALPGLLLIWGAGLERLFQSAHGVSESSPSPRYALRLILGAVLTSILLVRFLSADRNWFVDPAFTKAEWRQLAQYVRSQMNNSKSGESSDVVILVSGHAWPVWNYYAPDLPPLRLPNLEILDVNAVLDFASSAIPLRDALEKKENAWLVSWQDEIVDPMSIVPLQLNLAGREQEVDGQFWQLQLRHYADMDAGAVLLEPTAISESSVNFGNQVYQLDYTVADNGDLLLFWQLHPQHPDPMPDLQISGHTFTSDGLPFTRLNDRRLSSYEYPSFRWLPGQVTLGRIPAEDWAGPGALPGNYRIRMGVYELTGDLDGVDVIGPQGQPLGKQITMDVSLDQPTVGPDYVDETTFAQPIVDLFVELLLTDEQAEPGQLVGMELRWYAEERPTDDYDLLVRWRTRNDDMLAGEQVLPLSSDFPTGAWPDDELLRTQHQLRPPLNLPAGDYWLEVGLTAPDSTFVRVPFRVLGSSRIFNPPPYRTEVNETFGESLHLLGIIEPIQDQKQVGDQVVLTLVWQTRNNPQDDFSATVQWLGADARPVAQADLALPGGSSNWLPGQVELQTFIASSPQEPGEYRLVIAVYNANKLDLPRLLTSQGEDLVDLGTITVRP